MIRGIYLSSKPEMKGITLSKVLSELDLLKSSDPVVLDSKLSGSSMSRNQYTSDSFVTTLYESDSEVSISAFWNILDVLYSALPDYVFCYKLSDTKLLLSIMNYSDDYDSFVYERMVDELIRVTVFLVSSFGIENRDKIESLLRDYVGMCVKYDD